MERDGENKAEKPDKREFSVVESSENSDIEKKVDGRNENDAVFADAKPEKMEPVVLGKRIMAIKRKKPAESTPKAKRTERQKKPKTWDDYVSYYTVQDRIDEPEILEETLEGNEGKQWLKAMKTEYEALKKNNTWEYVEETGELNILMTKWVYKIKYNQSGEKQYKARLVAKGCAQKEGIDFQETFSPVGKYTSIRYLMSLAVKAKLNITHMDVTTAYLNSDLEEEIYVRPPKGIEGRTQPGKIWKLKKAMYGLKQSGRAWNRKLNSVLKMHRVTRSKADPCIYYCQKKGKTLIVALYVDDLLIFTNDKSEERPEKDTREKLRNERPRKGETFSKNEY